MPRGEPGGKDRPGLPCNHHSREVVFIPVAWGYVSCGFRTKKSESGCSVDGDHDLCRLDHGVDFLADGKSEVLYGLFGDDRGDLTAAVQRDDNLSGDHSSIDMFYFSRELVSCT